MERGSTPERVRHERREDLHAARRAGEAVGGAAAQRDEETATHQRPVQFGSRFSKNAFTPSWMSSVVNAIES